MRRNITVSVVIAILFTVISSSARAAPGAPDGPRYTGKKLSLDLQNAEMGDVLRLLADVSGLNIIASPEVKGTVTTRLAEVPWDQALDVILKLNGLAQERYWNVVLIVPLERVSRERQERLRARQVEAQGEPRVTRVIPVNYAQAAELKASLEKVLGVCATIAVDARTNTLILSGTPSCLRLQPIPAP